MNMRKDGKGNWHHPVYDAGYHPARLIELAKEGKSVVEVCADFGVSREAFYQWRDRHPEFYKAFHLAKVLTQAWWEDLARRGAAGEIPNFNSRATEFSMKFRFREDYTEVKQIQTTTISMNLSDEELLKRVQSKLQNAPQLLEVMQGNPLLGQVLEGELTESEDSDSDGEDGNKNDERE